MTFHNNMEHFFNTIDDSQKIVLDGEVLHDTAVIPNFCKEHFGIDHAELWNHLLACDTIDPSVEEIHRDFNYPRWIPGDQNDLKYRGNTVKRTKMWFQQDIEHYCKYSYTGWNHAISNASYDTRSVPLVDDFAEASHKVFDKKHNQWIVTKYMNGTDNIGFHSDKSHTWEKDSAFTVIKLGAPRPFQFAKTVPVMDPKTGLQKMQKTGDKLKPVFNDVVIWDKVLEPGTAVIVGIDANSKIKHGVPSVDGDVGVSGSIVGRAIAEKITWQKVEKESKRLRRDRLQRKRKREQSLFHDNLDHLHGYCIRPVFPFSLRFCNYVWEQVREREREREREKPNRHLLPSKYIPIA